MGLVDNIKVRLKRVIWGELALSHKKHNTQVQQIQLISQYHAMKKLLKSSEMPALRDVGFKEYSQFEEDGLLLYIFAIIGTTNKRVVEICAGNGIECMAANLLINHGWNGLLFDGDGSLVEHGRRFYSSNRSVWLMPPIFKHAWLTKENVDELIKESGFTGEIDLLSLDIDGNDYFILEAIGCIKPRVIICETNNVIPGDMALTMPYQPDFDKLKRPGTDFMGASVLAMKKLLSKKGYRLIGANQYGFNCIFMRDGVGTEYFPEVTVESILDNPYTKLRNTQNWEAVKDQPWVEV